MQGVVFATAGVGFVLGLRHALDPDHLAAVSTIVSERGGLRRSSLVGASWGVGHGLSLVGAGGAVLALRLSVPPAVERWLEVLVAVMLVLLGTRALYLALTGFTLHAHRHAHDGHEHVHVHAHRVGVAVAHHHAHPLTVGWRPFVVGMVHGLAGSAGLAVVAAGAAPTVAAGIAYIAWLAVGAVAGMLVLSTLMSLPLAALPRRYDVVQRRFQLLAGACSVALGLWLIVQNAGGRP